MFNNLIESSSHTREYKRRGSFLLFTGAGYLVLFAIAGVASIYAYDAHLEQQNTEFVTMLSPQLVADRQPEVAHTTERPRPSNSNESNIAVRSNPMLSVNHPELVPTGVSAKPNTNPPIPESGAWTPGTHDFTPGSVGGPAGPGNGSRVVAQPPTMVNLSDPPPAPDPPKPKPPQMVHRSIINSQATYLPKPIYPEIAKRMRIQGTVMVQVVVDVDGRVISAKAASGSPFLTVEAQKAALQARFSPTLLDNQPVKVSGVITYNFVLGNQ